LEYKANLDDDFITHHLKHELSLTKFVSTQRIHRRQIAEHILLIPKWNNANLIYNDLRIESFYETFVYAWIQRTFLDIWEGAH
jgi:hypothetical protein